MTYCIAWKNKEASFLISDTAITTTDKKGKYRPVKSKTSLGENTFHDKNITVEEWTLKQFRIDDNFIICYAGDVERALIIIKTIKKYYIKDNPLYSFEIAINSVRDFSNQDIVQFLFSFRINSEIKLYSYNAKNTKEIIEISENTLVQIGSLSHGEYFEVTNRMFNEHILTLKKSSQQFYQFLGYFQHLGLHDNTLKNFAGGLYSGLFLDTTKSHWADDTSIIIYDRMPSDLKIKIKGRINYFYRYDCLILYSSFTNQKELFIDSEDHLIYRSQDLQDEVDNIHYTFLPHVVLYLASDKRIMATIKTNGNNKNVHFSDENVDGKFTSKLSFNFVRLLKGDYFPAENLFSIYWDEVLPQKI